MLDPNAYFWHNWDRAAASGGGVRGAPTPVPNKFKSQKSFEKIYHKCILVFFGLLRTYFFTFKASESLKFLIVLCDTIFCQSKLYIYWCKFSSKNVSVISTPLVGKMMLQLCETIFDNLDHRITTQKMKFPFKDFFSKCDQIRWRSS